MSCVSLLLVLLCLLLAALQPFAANKHTELLMAARVDEDAKLIRTETVAKDTEAPARKRKEESTTKLHHFRTRKLPSDAKNRFDGRVPFTADYSGIQSSPSKHH